MSVNPQADPFTGKMRAMSWCCYEPIVSMGFMSDTWPICSGCKKPIKMRRRTDEYIKSVLKQLPEVMWDRFSVDTKDEYIITVFGWIDRPQDEYKDYCELSFNGDSLNSCSTSSARYSAEFCERLGFDHNDCQRVEERFPVSNMIKLSEDTWS